MKKVLKGLLLSLLALGVGYVAISLPFNLFNTLSDAAMEVIFIGELVIYSAVGGIFLLVNENQKTQKRKAEQRHIERKEKIARVQTDWYDLAA
ncbi:MAG: hypothetical protein IJS03_05595 [Eubacterium sp.]|nr:hypothetical protein [Eubacterium sp.]